MSPEVIGLLGIGALMVLLLLRAPIAISLILVSFVGIWVTVGPRPAWGILVAVPYEFASKWTLSSVPMFLLMGYVCFHAGLTRGLFEACRVWLARLPGGLAIASVFASGGFAAVTGSSVACAAAMGRIAVPEMIDKKYAPSLATGSIAAAGTLGALIPPSILLILYGVFVEAPISRLFMGGVGAGVLTALAYAAAIALQVKITPSLAPRLDERFTLREKLSRLAGTWPILALVAMVLGGMGSGLFTATEAGAVGAFLSMVFAALRGVLTREVVWRSLVETLTTTGTLFVIAVGANLLTRFLAFSGAADLIASTIIGFGAEGVMLIVGIAALYLVLGMFLEPLGAMLLTLPVLMPVIDKAGIDVIWFGVFLVKFLEIGMITPPIGLNVFVIKSVVGNLASLGTIFRGIVWFLAADLVVVAIMVAVPAVVLWLPSVTN